MVRMRFGFVKGAASKLNASWKPPWRASTPMVDQSGSVSSNSQCDTLPPGARQHYPVMRWCEHGLQATALFQLLDDPLDLLALRHRCHESRVGRCHDRNVPKSDHRKHAPLAAQVCVLAIDGHDVANRHIASVGLTSRRDCQEPRSLQRKPAGTIAMPLAFSMIA